MRLIIHCLYYQSLVCLLTACQKRRCGERLEEVYQLIVKSNSRRVKKALDGLSAVKEEDLQSGDKCAATFRLSVILIMEKKTTFFDLQTHTHTYIHKHKHT